MIIFPQLLQKMFFKLLNLQEEFIFQLKDLFRNSIDYYQLDKFQRWLKKIEVIVESSEVIAAGINTVEQLIINSKSSSNLKVDSDLSKRRSVAKFRELKYQLLCFQKRFAAVIIREASDAMQIDVKLKVIVTLFMTIMEFVVGLNSEFE